MPIKMPYYCSYGTNMSKKIYKCITLSKKEKEHLDDINFKVVMRINLGC